MIAHIEIKHKDFRFWVTKDDKSLSWMNLTRQEQASAIECIGKLYKLITRGREK